MRGCVEHDPLAFFQPIADHHHAVVARAERHLVCLPPAIVQVEAVVLAAFFEHRLARHLEHVRYGGRRGGLARMKRLRERLEAEGRTLSDYQREIRGHVSSDACRRNGARGAAATLAKHGYAALHEKVIAWRLAHPSEPERQVMAILDELGLAYELVRYARDPQTLRARSA